MKNGTVGAIVALAGFVAPVVVLGAFVLARDGVVGSSAGAWGGEAPRAWGIVTRGAGGEMVKVGSVFEDYGGFTYAQVDAEGGGPYLKLLQAGPCDVNRDGFVNGVDFDTFTAWFVAGDRRADFDRDGFVTGADFDGFVERYAQGG